MGCSRISDYELQGKLGEGTFGEVHRAKSKKTGALVALKKIIMHNEKDGVSRSGGQGGQEQYPARSRAALRPGSPLLTVFSVFPSRP